MSVSVRHHTTQLNATTSTLVIAANRNRKFLKICNPDSSIVATVKFGGAVNAAVTGIQTISFSATPNDGTWKVTFNGVESGSLAKNISNTALQTALRLVTGLGSVTVTGSVSAGFVVTMVSVMVNGSVDIPLMSVTSSTLSIDEIQTLTFAPHPTAGTFKLQYKGFITGALNFNDSASTIQTSLQAFSAVLASVTVSGTVATSLVITYVGIFGNADPIQIVENSLSVAAVTEVQTITFNSTPDAGAWKITYAGNESGSLVFGATSAQVQTALRLLPGLSTVTVSGSMSAGMVVTMTGVVGDASAMTVTSNTLTTSSVAVVPTITETTKGVALNPTIVPTVVETTAGSVVTGAVVLTTLATVADGYPLAAKASETYTGESCPIDAVYALSASATPNFEVVEG